MNRLHKLLILLVCLGLVFVEKETTKAYADETKAETVSTDGSLYTNELFNLSISKPESWYAQSMEELLKTHQLGANLVSGSDRNLQAIMKESLETSLPLFSFYQYLPGTPTPSNPNISGVAENISLYPGIKEGCDYLYSAKQLMAQSQIRIIFEDNCRTKNINGSKLGYFNASIYFGDREVKQRYYACVQNNHAISLVETYFDAASEQNLENILSTLQVKCD